MTLERRRLMDLRRTALAFVDAIEHALGWRPTTRDIRLDYRRRHPALNQVEDGT